MTAFRTMNRFYDNYKKLSSVVAQPTHVKKWLLLLLFILSNSSTCFAQERVQQLIDSLLIELNKAKVDTHKITLLNKIAYSYPYINPDIGLKYGQQSLALAEKLVWSKGVAGAHMSIGANYANKSDYDNALKHDYIALKLYEQLKDKSGQAGLLRNIGIVLRNSKNQHKALEYEFKALKLFEELQDSIGMAIMFSNIANVYYSLKNKEKVIEYNFKALRLYHSLQNAEGTARVTGNIANFYAMEGDFSKAMIFYFEALRKENELKNVNGVTRNMGNIGETYLDIYRNYSKAIKPDSLIPAGPQENLMLAKQYLETTIKHSKELKQTEYYLAFAEVLSDVYLLLKKPEKSLELYKEYILVRDSVYDVEKINEAARKELNYEFGKKEDSLTFQNKLTDIKLVQEKRIRKEESLFFTCGILIVLVFSIFLYNRWRLTQKQKQLIEVEKQRSDQLLLNILPHEVAEELKVKGSAEAKHFDEVSVMFTDFKGFTQISEKLTPVELVEEINNCFKAFDTIISKYNIEKIKTIGDAYMCAGGLPVKSATHAIDVVNAALEIQQFMHQHRQQREQANKEVFELRIGIHTGPVVAGIVGLKKFAYDIWGDTVNIASRMESSGEAGKVNISGQTHALVKEYFSCVPRGKIQAKNKGEVDMFFVNRTTNG
jgi:adenylate cyclase